MQTGYLYKDYNPTIKDRYFYPQTPILNQIQQLAGNQNLVIVGGDTLLTGTNLFYKLHMPNGFDAIWVKFHDQLFKQTFGDESVAHATTQVNRSGLKLFGVDYVVAPKSWRIPNDIIDNLQQKATHDYLLDPIVPGQEILQTFRATQDQLQTINLTFATFNRTNRCRVKVSLKEVVTNTSVYEDTLQCQKIKDSRETILSFPPILNSRGKEYSLMVSSEDANSSNALTLLAKSDLAYPDGNLRQGQQSLSGGLIFNFTYTQTTDFKLVGQDNNYNIYHFQDSLSNYYTVGQALVVTEDAKALKLLDKAEFDPYKQVVLSQPGEKGLVSSEEANSKVQVLAEQATSVRLLVTRQQPGYLVLTKTYYPGWKAKVNGEETPLLRANYAFNAIPLKPGTNQVEFYYEPDSFKYGLLITFGSIILGLLFLSYPFFIRILKKSAD